MQTSKLFSRSSALILVASALACGQDAEPICLDVEWTAEVEVEDIRNVCDVRVDEDGSITLFVDAPDAIVLRFDRDGEKILESKVMHPGSMGVPECRGMDVAERGDMWLLTAETSPLAQSSWAHRVAPDGSIASVQLPKSGEERWISGPSLVNPSGAALFGGWRGPSEGAGAGVVARADPELLVNTIWTDSTGALGPVTDVIAAADGGVLATAREKATVDGDAHLVRIGQGAGGLLWNEVIGAFGADGEPSVLEVRSDGNLGALVALADDETWAIERRDEDGLKAWTYEVERAPPASGLALSTNEDFVIAVADSSEDASYSEAFVLSADAERACRRPQRLEYGAPRAAAPADDDSFIVVGEKRNTDGDLESFWLTKLNLRGGEAPDEDEDDDDDDDDDE